ncbi:MAG: aminopeptidase P family protein [Chloroflexi bacterium]|nr:aminopeptidase P family protein [Chloroflexota bacterium]
MNRRVTRLREKLAEQGLDALWISQPENRRYLSGFFGTAGFLLISQSAAILATDFRYTEQAAREAPDFQIFQSKGEIPAWLPSLLGGLPIGRLALEATDLTMATYHRIADTVKTAGLPIELVATEGIVERLRAVKEAQEIYSITGAARLADAAAEHCRTVIRRGMTEKDLAWEMEKFMRERGSGPTPFSLIVACGPNAAMPHHHPTTRSIELGEPVIIDIGANVDGYLSDLSRTVCLERQDRTYDKLYNIVLEAQLAAIEYVQAGRPAVEVDQCARDVITRAGYGEAFGHGLGHGVGLAGHEAPRLGPLSDAILEENMVFTVEPGIYIKDWGGIRIEDMVVIENGKARVITQSRK